MNLFISFIIVLIDLGTKKQKSYELITFAAFLVGLPGFEPGMTGPESVVLPLHHSPIVIISVLRLQRYKDFYKSKQKRVFFSQKTDKIP